MLRCNWLRGAMGIPVAGYPLSQYTTQLISASRRKRNSKKELIYFLTHRAPRCKVYAKQEGPMECLKCGKNLPEEEFYLEPGTARGRKTVCKACGRERRRAHAAKIALEGVAPEKRCSRCGETKPASAFHLNLAAAGGLQPHCKDCDRRAYSRDRKSKLAASGRYKRKRYAEDPGFRLRSLLSSSLSSFVRGELGLGPRKSFRALSRRIGVSGEEFMSSLRAKLVAGMRPSGYGAVWELDHAEPVSAFDHGDPEQVRRCWHPDNVRPAFVESNRAKGPHGKSEFRLLRA